MDLVTSRHISLVVHESLQLSADKLLVAPDMLNLLDGIKVVPLQPRVLLQPGVDLGTNRDASGLLARQILILLSQLAHHSMELVIH